MKRRMYLTTAAAAMVAGCSALSDSETADEDSDADDDRDGSSDSIDEELGAFDDFEDLSLWTVMEGTLTADQERVYTGTQSARMDAAASDERLMIKREFDTPRDLSSAFPALAFASDHDVTPVVQLTDTDGDRLLLECAVNAAGPFVHRDLGIANVVGEPDLRDIEHTKISVWAGDRELSLWCDDYRLVGRPDTGRVLFQFPDGYESVATEAAPILDAHDYPATVFVNTDYVDGEDRLSRSDLESLQDDGWTIASQGADNAPLTQRDAAGQEAQLSSAVTWLDDHGFDSASFSYPLDDYDESALELVDEYHDLGFVGGFAGHGHLTNPALAPRATSPDADEVATLLEWTAEYNTITTLSYRDLEGDTYGAFEAAVSMVADLDAEGELEVVVPDDVVSDNIADSHVP
ncbi:polysaccharide deacetylase family protein [Natronorubrum sulfidifaciens]|uniref:Polysaccharide deacetylase n=1 Tax=Natronorubrum sulfidifaciens JCM 14089 TaxID=1230460 RepID=L9WBS3_9EURY|nr:polysaccharide deacetylase family protein [Natronorubrum sulfidifaciens]ELY46721.1 polysaccharide deacetylase [Natronorubrum sulfidifaciens JCM 14089]